MSTQSTMNRFTASLIHLIGSAIVVVLVFVLVRALWYPGRLFEAASGTDLMTILILVDVTLGPLITLIIYSPGKPSLKSDVRTVIVVQIAFLLFGIWSIFSARPAFIAFSEDRFFLVTANEIDTEDLLSAKNPEFQSLPLTGPKIVGAVLPEDVGLREKIAIGNLVGMGVQHLPQSYVSYAQIAQRVTLVAMPSAELGNRSKNVTREEQARLSAYEAKKRAEGINVRFVPLVSRAATLYVAVDEANGTVIDIP